MKRSIQMAEEAAIRSPHNVYMLGEIVHNQVEKLKLEAKQGLKFDSSKIPYSSNYIFFDNKNKVVKANTNEDETKNINKYLNGEKFSSKYVYDKIIFKDGTFL